MVYQGKNRVLAVGDVEVSCLRAVANNVRLLEVPASYGLHHKPLN